MKNIALLFIIVVSNFPIYAQSPDYDDLQVLFASKEYEKLVRKGIGYTEKDNTKVDVLPYVWVARGLYEISESDNTDEKYKDAGKDALNYMSKALKNAGKYNSWNYIDEHEEFLETMRMKWCTSIVDDIGTNEPIAFKKAYGNVMKYQKIMNSDIPVNFVIGVCKFNNKDKTGAGKAWRAAVDSIEVLDNIDDWGIAERKLLKTGVAFTVKSYKESRQDEAAQKLLGKMAQWFEGDEEWDDLYDNIVNGVE